MKLTLLVKKKIWALVTESATFAIIMTLLIMNFNSTPIKIQLENPELKLSVELGTQRL